MKDLFRERFQGHEAPVDPATWQVIEARLLTSVPAADGVSDLFRERFRQHEMDVDPGVWQGISSQLGHGVGAGSGLWGGHGWIAAGVAAVATTGALLFFLGGNPAPPPAPGTLASSPATVEPALTGADPAPAAEDPNGTHAAVAAVEPEQSRKRKGTPQADPEAVRQPEAPIDGPASGPTERAEVVDQILEGITVQTMLQVLSQEQVQPAIGQAAVPAGNDDRPEVGTKAPPVAPAAAEEIPKLFLPNTFTPNGDGINDTYRVMPRIGFSNTLVRVYSMKTNQLVFSSNNLEDEWTGAGCDDGMYLVAVEAITLEGRVISDGKVVWLNRSIMN